ncbi:sugar phosphate isomerase/epimerase family protein [Phytohabitans kaempferiae]|uniref:Sugar phosphate isomerase/epimerase family protein n=1 Tax=Phytohabitans kaempferiae TaxID=1620943 RepID=A0ABV6M2W3_9ACTN
MRRRNFLYGASSSGLLALAPLAAIASPASAAPKGAPASRPGGPTRRPPQITWTIFSRHLQWLTTQAYAHQYPYETGVLVGEAAAEMGYAAVDLTVRPGGHVEPAAVRRNLAPMLRGVRSTGVRCAHITTGFTSRSSEYADEVLTTAADQGIRYYRWGSFSYRWDADAYGDTVLAQLEDLRKEVRSLAVLSRRLGMTGIYHTFSGGRVGSSVWDLLHLLDTIDPDALAINFDIGHLVAEGAVGSWQTNLRTAFPRVRGVGLKDSTVTRAANGAVRAGWVPAGQGFVPWVDFFRVLHDGGFSGPCEAQIEYVHQGVNLNTTFWADTPSFTLSRAQMLGTIATELSVYQAAASEAGWTATEQH